MLHFLVDIISRDSNSLFLLILKIRINTDFFKIIMIDKNLTMCYNIDRKLKVRGFRHIPRILASFQWNRDSAIHDFTETCKCINYVLYICIEAFSGNWRNPLFLLERKILVWQILSIIKKELFCQKLIKSYWVHCIKRIFCVTTTYH